MKREDRPKQSIYKKQLAEGAVPPPVCSECAFVFTEEAVKRGARARKRKDGTVRCQEDKACRSRALTTTLGKELEAAPPEDWLYFKYPRDRVKAEMDVRPKSWKETGWKSRSGLDDRVMACILYHSWCWPVSLPFAVQLAGTLPHPARRDFDDDEILVDQYKQPRPLRLVDIAFVLNEHKTNVWTRGIQRLVATKNLRLDEDGVFYPAAQLAEMTIEERKALYLPHHLETDPDDELRGVPKRYRKLLAQIEAHTPAYISEDIRTDIFHRVKERCSTFNDGLRVLRTERDAGIEQDCLRGTTLCLPTLESRPKAKPSVSPRASKNTPPVMGAVPTAASSSSSQAAVHTPKTTTPQQPAWNFTAEMISVFVGAGKANPTPKQITEVERSLPKHPAAQPAFVAMLGEKIARIKHPGSLPSVVAEFIVAWPALLKKGQTHQEAVQREAQSLLAQDRQAAVRILENRAEALPESVTWAEEVMLAVLSDPDAGEETKNRAKEVLGKGAMAKLPTHGRKKGAGG